MTSKIKINGYINGKLIVATPMRNNALFDKSVIFICKHDENGAMGIILNKPENIKISDLVKQLDMDNKSIHENNKQILRGGPVDITNGFIIHDNSYKEELTTKINKEFALTSTVEILKNIAKKQNPKKYIIALGYSGWGKGQLEKEIAQNMWLCIDATDKIVFNSTPSAMWYKSLIENDINPENMVTTIASV